MADLPTVLFVCVKNAGRSQMAAAFARALGEGRVRALSAGSAPADAVHPEVVAVLREVGIDVAALRPQRLTPELAREADVIVTMGCGDACPAVPGVRRIDWNVTDPHGRPLDEVRAIRDDVRARVEALLRELG